MSLRFIFVENMTDESSSIESTLKEILENTNDSTTWGTIVLQILTILIVFLKPIVKNVITKHFELKNKELETKKEIAEIENKVIVREENNVVQRVVKRRDSVDLGKLNYIYNNLEEEVKQEDEITKTSPLIRCYSYGNLNTLA